ncbi:MAG: CPBP family glutamic-type intramembrane protease [Candidatus Methanomethylicaceae archaeon]
MEEYTSKILKILTKIYGILALIIIITYAISFIIVIYCIIFSPQGLYFQSKIFHSLRLNILYFQFIRIPIEFNAGQLLSILHIIFIISFLTSYFSYKKYSIINLIKEGDVNYIKKNFLILMPAISSFIFIITLIMHTLFERVGIGVGGPSYEDPLITLLSLSYAIVSEEIGFRLIPILIPSGIYIIIKLKFRKIFLAIFKPEMVYSKDRILRIIQISLIFISAFLFSYAHIAFNIWDIGKIPSSFIAGIVIGLCAVKYGFDAAILIHWYFNYYWYALLLPSRLGLNFDFLFNFSFSLTFYIVLVVALIFILRIKIILVKK